MKLPAILLSIGWWWALAVSPVRALPPSVKIEADQGRPISAAQPRNPTNPSGFPPVFPLVVGKTGRYLVDSAGVPFLVVGDTAWSLIAQLKDGEVEEYLENRRRKSFNAIIVNLLEHKFADRAPSTIEGLSPFLAPGDFRRPNPAYFDLAHRVVRAAETHGISVWLCPAYLGWDGGDEGFYQEIRQAGPAALRAYGRFVGERFRDLPNLVWMPGGDYALPEEARWTGQELALGLREGGALQIMTAHGGQTTALATFGDQPWLAVDSVYGYQEDLWQPLLAAWKHESKRPFVMLESAYEGEHQAPPARIRAQAWWSMLCGAAGQFFGNNPIWYFDGPGFLDRKSAPTWRQALDLAGSRDISRLAGFLSRYPWHRLVPDLETKVITSGAGDGAHRITVARTADGDLGMAYIPANGIEPREFVADLSAFSGPLAGQWFNPAVDEPLRRFPGSLSNRAGQSLRTPGNNGAGANDWVLVLESAPSVSEIPPPTDAPRPLPPEASAAAYRLPEGFRLELVASEPLVASPSGIAWDEQGNLFVTELHGYNLEGQLEIEELNKAGQLDTEVRRVQAAEKFKQAAQPGTYGVVKLLRDTDGDGRMDQADGWATNLPPAYGLVPARGGVIVACAPHILFLADRDGDGRAEVRETLFTGFPVQVLERGINAPQWGNDGWIYFGRGASGGTITGPNLRQPVRLPGSDFRIRADGSAIEPVSGGTGTFGFALTETGDRFVMSTGEPGRFVAPLPWRYLMRNPDAATPSLERPTGDRRVFPRAAPHPWRRKRAEDPAYFKFYRDRYGASDSEASGWFTSACSPLIYQDAMLPGLQGHYLVCEPAGSLIHRATIEPDGSALRLVRPPEESASEFAASNDSWSHPMNLVHGPDGAVWVVDYYREIIEDYSAIPRHLQQQYGLYAGHDRGRIYRLTHRDAPRPPSLGMAALDGTALVREIASPLRWRRLTAQRLLAERGDASMAPGLRRMLATPDLAPSTIIAGLRTLEWWNVLRPEDLTGFVDHPAESVRVHALQLADPWFRGPKGTGLLRNQKGTDLWERVLATAAAERSPRVQIQFALSLGEADDPRAFAMLARFAREFSSVSWMDAAILSSLHGRSVEMLAELVREPGGSHAFLESLAQSIAARRVEADLARALLLSGSAAPEVQSAILKGLAKGRKNAPHRPLTDPLAGAVLARLGASVHGEVRGAARALEDTLLPALAGDPLEQPAPLPASKAAITDEAFREYVGALSAPRDLRRGQDLFRQTCATCHRLGDEGHAVGPDLMGQLGIAEEGLLKDVLLPDERIRTGYEATLVEMADREPVTGILREDGATSLTVVLPNGVEQVLLRRDVTGVRRLPGSLMPSFAETLSPEDLAHLLAWMRSLLPGTGPGGPSQER